MTRITLRHGFVAVALFASNVTLSGLGYHGWYSTEAALAASAVPIVDPAPGRFSTTTGCPRRSPTPGASSRHTTSIAPAGGHGAMRVIRRDG